MISGCRYGSGELLGVVPVKLDEAGLFGEIACTRIQESSVDVTKVRGEWNTVLALR